MLFSTNLRKENPESWTKILVKGAFNNYVDKMRGEGRGGQKMYVFVHAQGMKTVHVVVEWPPMPTQKNNTFLHWLCK